MQPKTTDTTKLHRVKACPFAGMITRWLDFCRANGLSEKTLHDYEDKSNKFLWWYKHTGYYDSSGSHPVNVSIEHATEFVTYLRSHQPERWGIIERTNNNCGKDLSPASIASYGRVVKVFFNWLANEDYIETSPFAKVSFTTNKGDNEKEGQTEEVATYFERSYAVKKSSLLIPAFVQIV